MTAQRSLLFTALLLLTALAPLPASGQSISSYSLTLRTSCPASCRDVTSKKPIGTYSYTVTYRYEVDMNAWDTTGNYIPDYDFMRLEISPDGLSRYYSTTADRRDSIMYRARTDANHRGGVDLDSWKPEERFALYEDTYLNWPEAGELTVRTGMVKEEFEYTEPVPQMTWQFLNIPPRTVCGYQCMAAALNVGLYSPTWPSTPASSEVLRSCRMEVHMPLPHTVSR